LRWQCVDGGSGTAVADILGIAFRKILVSIHQELLPLISTFHTPNNPDLDRYANLETFNSFVRETVRRVRAIPGVDLASITTDLPVTHLSRRSAVKIEDRPDESGKGLFSEVTSVTPEYFKVLQASLIRGRYFTEDEDAGKQPVAIIDESTARTYWPDRDAIGRRLSMATFRRTTHPSRGAPWLA